MPQLVAPSEIAARPLFPSCLYALAPGEAASDPWKEAPWVTGEHARRRGAEAGGRLVASSKSWLCHARVDRTAPILPWGSAEDEVDLPHLSPVDAAARLLEHVRATWDATFPDAPLADQEVVLTVPASFDEVARELTLEAATRAGLSVRLLEEPQAAFYDFMGRAGADGLRGLLREGSTSALVLVCDVGGGTTDLSLIRVSAALGAGVRVERVAVGQHLLLGGDNMDLALALTAESRLGEKLERLDAGRFGQLVGACRAAKERLLAADGPETARVTVLGRGARLFGGALSTELTREETDRIVLDGFFPSIDRSSRAARGDARDARDARGARGGLVAAGLPYERDPAITRHIASFLARHAPEERADDDLRAVLFNGGVFLADRIARRTLETLRAWSGSIQELPHADPDLAVARGAVAYALARHGHGLRIGGGSARGYYVGVESAGGSTRAVCVVPKGAEEGVPQVVHERPLKLVVGRPVRFDLFASDAASDAPGDVVSIDEDRFEALPPVAIAFSPVLADQPSAGTLRAGQVTRRAEEIEVRLEGELTAIGTLDLACVEAGGDHRRFRLAFQLSGDAARADALKARLSTRPPPSLGGKRVDDAREAIDRVFGKGRADVAAREAKDLMRELERLLGERSSWSTELSRALFDAIVADGSGAKARRRSPDHERMFWMLAGYTLRPGFGDPADPGRVAEIAPLFAERVLNPNEPRNWQAFWIAWRRVVGGLDEAAQIAMRDVLDPLIAPAEARLKKPKGWKAEWPDDLLELASWIERVPAGRRSLLGGWILEKTWTSRDPTLWAALGRIGARIPAYASAHHVLMPMVAERWIDHLLREKWEGLPSAAPAAVQLARITGDRARDVSDRARREVENRLVAVGAREDQLRAVRELIPLAESDRAALFGEGLPVGLKLVE